MVLIRANLVTDDAEFWLNDEPIVYSGRTDALLVVPDDATEAEIEAAVKGPKRFVARQVCLPVLEPKEE